MPQTLPTRDQLATFPPAIADMLINATAGMLHGTLALPITFATANNAVLFTVPAGYRMQVVDAAWEPLVSWTGGASSAIGLGTSNAGYPAAGALLGGASGDVLAGLTATPATPLKRTIGSAVAAGVWLIAGDTIRFNQITSAFTAGTGFAHVFYRLVPSV